MLHDKLGSWVPVFYIVISLDILTAILALLILKPLRRRWFAGGGSAKSLPVGRIAEA
jgi:hypothetical protein